MNATSSPQIFVLGNSRSGTTMMARILGRHSQVADLQEMHFIEQIITGAEFAAGQDLAPDRAVDLAARLLSVLRDGYFFAGDGAAYRTEAADLASAPISAAALFEKVRLSEAQKRGKTIPLEQTPRNVFYIPELLAAYPQARILCMVRDPRDVCLSQKGKWRRRFLGANIPLFEALRAWGNYHPLVTAKIWSGAVQAGDAHGDHPQVKVVRYEDVAANPEQVVRDICAHCALTFEPDILNVAQQGSSDRQDVTGATGVDTSRIGTWQNRLSPAEIALCERVAGPDMARHGYDPAPMRANPIGIVFWWALLPLKLAMALALNLKRVKSLGSWLRKRLFSKPPKGAA